MPTYEFACPDCGERFEVRMSIQERELKRAVPCPKCGREDTRRVFSSFGIGRGGGGPSGGGPPGCCGGGPCPAG